jgi:phosphoribosylformylglycinamidine synthase subunit PurSL
MLWEIEILPNHADLERARVNKELALLTHDNAAGVDQAARGFLVEGDLDQEAAERLMRELLVDPLVETGRTGPLNAFRQSGRLSAFATVLYKPGVMDPVAESVELAARDLDIPLASVRTFRRYYACGGPLEPARSLLFRKILGNEAIEQVVAGPLSLEHLTLGSEYKYRLVTVPIRALDDAGLVALSKTGQLSLSLAEMQTIQTHFRDLGRDPTDIELETIAQTWSEHCSHKTLKGIIDFTMTDAAGTTTTERIDSLLKVTIFGSTQELRRQFGADDWCVSVFSDNAGIVRFDDKHNVCFKVETHNRPSAIEPYGGANTGIGGVIRDVLGTALGAKPICNTDVFCFAPPTTPAESLPPGVLHPQKVIHGVVAGVREYGNRMGIPTVNGAVCFDPRYVGNPLVYCGTVGVIPIDKSTKSVEPGDLIVALGGRTGRDGIHGATFSSAELDSESEKVSGGAVQIGNAIAEKKLADVLLAARDRGLYRAVTDCGAGGFSSAVGEMGEKIGAEVHLDRAPLKYQGLTYTETWISEAQERMVLAVPPENWDGLRLLCESENVEATALGTFEPTGRLKLVYKGEQVGDLDMHFLHDGRPDVVRKATWTDERRGSSPPNRSDTAASTSPEGINPSARQSPEEILLGILGSLNVCSKEWIIRQYDHEVQAGSVLKPLVGVRNDGPGDAAVVTPVLGSWAGLAIGCGINPHLGDLDPYRMAALAIDEAVRNVVAVGADPSRIALLDNFCWGNTDRPEVLGSLVRAAQACRDVAVAYRMPFISGKDSLKNEFRHAGETIAIPPTLLISAMGRVADVRRCVSMDLKEPGNVLFLVGTTGAELGGSHYGLVTKEIGGAVPSIDAALAPRIFAKVHEAIAGGMVRSCHDLSEGGLAVSLAEMAFAGEIGADVTSLPAGSLGDVEMLFAESPTRFLLEVPAGKTAAVRQLFGNLPLAEIGRTVREKRLRIAGRSGEWLLWTPLDKLKEAWQKPLRW